MDLSQPRFDIGIHPKKKKARRVKKILPVRRTRPLKIYTLGLRKRWLLLPNISTVIQTFLYHAGGNSYNILEAIKAKKKILKRYVPAIPNRFEFSARDLSTCLGIVYKNQRLRTAFGQLARRWIWKRFKQGNQEDLLTGESPKFPVTLVDWAARYTYIFEARTICRDMVERLLMTSYGGFPKPLLPRNPYTNTDMTEGQFYDVMRQLRQHGTTHWILEALYSTNYCVAQMEKELYFKLRYHSLKQSFANPAHAHGQTLLIEYIEDEHAFHGKIYREDVYKWAMENAPTSSRMTSWRTLCYMYHKLEIDILQANEKAVEKKKIERASCMACGEPTELIKLMKKGEIETTTSEEEEDHIVYHVGTVDIHALIHFMEAALILD